MDNFLLFTILTLLIITSFCYLKMFEYIESFQVYNMSPFNHLSSNDDPMTFYKLPICKNPYRYPYKYYSSYPYPYMSYYPVNN